MRPTPHHTTGPFFPRQFVPDEQSDLTRVPGQSKAARGSRLELSGTVRDGRGVPAVNVTVELYQADADGKLGPSRDEGFAGWGRAWTDREGGYRFFTVMPGPYPVPRSSWTRPPHLTLLILGSGIMRPLVTEVFFPGEPLNALDRQFLAVPPRLRDRLVARPIDPATGQYRFDIVLRGANETPFIGIPNS